jgi:histidyl-tRNA synthetase
MRDIIGEEAELYEYLFSEFRSIARARGFEPIITPTLEYFKLFEAKSGEEIRNAMYVFEDKSGRLLALRPEITASVIRAYIRHMRARPKPIRLYYIAQCFRYEEPQYARYREFWQGGLEIIGDPDVNADLSAAITASEFLERVGVKHYYIAGNVLVYRSLMRKMNIEEEFQDHILHLIDKDQVDRALEELKAKVGDEKAEIFKRFVEVGDINKLEQLIEGHKDFLGELYETVQREQERMLTFIDTLRQLGYDVRYSSKLVRGLAYYTGLIFEYKVPSEKLTQSIGGGGRYDGLTAVYGAPFEYSTGLALGIDRIALVLKESFKPRHPVKAVILVLDNAPLHIGYKIAKMLPRDFLEVFVYRARSISRALEYANKLGCRYVLIYGEKEHSMGVITLKDMSTGEQKQVPIGDVLKEIQPALHAR